MSKPVDVGSLRVGGYVIIDNEPCKIVEIAKSKPGKHGAAKARVVAIGIFDGQKRTFVKPVDAQMEVPIIEKRSGQIVSLMPSSVQVMDLENYSVFKTALPEDETLASKLQPGTEVEYWNILGRTKIVRTK